MINFLFQLLPNLTPLLLTAGGVLFTELAGVLNIGAEGMMVWGAFFSLAIYIWTQNIFLALLGAGLAGGLAGALVALMHIRYQANVFIAGLAINLFAWGLTPILGSLFFGIRGVISLSQLGIPISEFAIGLRWLQFLGFSFLGVSWWILFRTRTGTVYRALYADSEGVTNLGISKSYYQRIALIGSGVLAGLAGAALAFRLGAYVPNMSAGRGWISLVVVFLGNMKPLGLLVASVIFSSAELLASRAQEGFGSPGLLIGLPYLLTLLALVIWAVIRRLSTK